MLKKRKRKSTHLSIIRTWSQKISKFRMCPTHWPHWAFMSIYKELVFSILLSPTLVRKKKKLCNSMQNKVMQVYELTGEVTCTSPILSSFQLSHFPSFISYVFKNQNRSYPRSCVSDKIRHKVTIYHTE